MARTWEARSPRLRLPLALEIDGHAAFGFALNAENLGCQFTGKRR
jgi:hypothetical protein